MKKIVLVTFFNSHNFGAGLQAYATYRILEDEGNSVKFLNYRNKYESKYEKMFGFMKNVSIVNNFKMLVKKTVFFGFINGYLGFKNFNNLLPKTRRYSKKSLAKFDTKDESDLVVIGSDQVWNPQITGGIFDYTFWGGFTDKPLISFSSSAGSYQYTDREFTIIRPYLEKFKTITVRESYLKDQLCAQNIKSKIILDPTLILGGSEWKKIAKQYSIISPPEKPYIFLYLVSTKYQNCRDYIQYLKEQTDYQIVFLDKYNINHPEIDYHIKRASPFDWVNLLLNSQYVLTDSFHGTAFSLMFNKSFSVIKTNNPKRIENILDLVNLNYRLVSSLQDFTTVWDKAIDYHLVEKKLHDESVESLKIVVDSLQ